MENVAVLLIAVLAAIIVLPIVAIVTANSRANQVRAELAGLMSRIHYLEQELEALARRMAAPAEPPHEAAQAAHAMPATAAFSPPPEVEAPRFVEREPSPAPPLAAAGSGRRSRSPGRVILL